MTKKAKKAKYVCYIVETGQIVSVKDEDHEWSEVEKGIKKDRKDLNFKVKKFMLNEDELKDYSIGKKKYKDNILSDNEKYVEEG